MSMLEDTKEIPYVVVSKEVRSQLLDNFMISEDELDRILEGKDQDSVFPLYMTSLNFKDCGKSIFELHGLDMSTKMRFRSSVDGCSCLYDVLMCSPFEKRKHGELFGFIKNNLVLNRELKDGELL
jgi:hypothetical protein